jgi:hypothetical protein
MSGFPKLTTFQVSNKNGRKATKELFKYIQEIGGRTCTILTESLKKDK